MKRSRPKAALGDAPATIIALRALQHELHNALAPVSALAEAARAHPHDKALVDLALRRASESGPRVSQIAARVLEAFLALPGEHAGESGGDRCDVGQVLREIADVRRALRPELRYEVDVLTRTPAAAGADAVAILAMNAILNAEAASPRGGVIRLGCSARNTSGAVDLGDVERAGVEISIEDEGPGIQPTAGQRLAKDRTDVSPASEPAKTSYNSSLKSPADQGPVRGEAGMSKPTGMGLQICRRVAAAVGGRIELHRREAGVGTRVSVWLPAA